MNSSPFPIGSAEIFDTPYFFQISVSGTCFSDDTLRLILQILIQKFPIRHYEMQDDVLAFSFSNLTWTNRLQLKQVMDFIRYKLLTSTNEILLLNDVRKEILGDAHAR